MGFEPDFEHIYREYHQRVLNLCAYLLSSRDAADDAAQEVFLRVKRRIQTYNPEYSFSNWILKITSNYCLDILRRRGIERRLFRADDSESAEPSATQPSPLTGVLTAERSRRIRKALWCLPGKFRVPLVLAYYNEFSYDEIAAVMNIPRNTVATLLLRGKQQLRRELEKEQEP